MNWEEAASSGAADEAAGAANCTAPPGAHGSVGKFIIVGTSEASAGESSKGPHVDSPLLIVSGAAPRVNLPYSTGRAGHLARETQRTLSHAVTF